MSGRFAKPQNDDDDGVDNSASCKIIEDEFLPFLALTLETLESSPATPPRRPAFTQAGPPSSLPLWKDSQKVGFGLRALSLPLFSFPHSYLFPPLDSKRLSTSINLDRRRRRGDEPPSHRQSRASLRGEQQVPRGDLSLKTISQSVGLPPNWTAATINCKLSRADDLETVAQICLFHSLTSYLVRMDVIDVGFLLVPNFEKYKAAKELSLLLRPPAFAVVIAYVHNIRVMGVSYDDDIWHL